MAIFRRAWPLHPVQDRNHVLANLDVEAVLLEDHGHDASVYHAAIALLEEALEFDDADLVVKADRGPQWIEGWELWPGNAVYLRLANTDTGLAGSCNFVPIGICKPLTPATWDLLEALRGKKTKTKT